MNVQITNMREGCYADKLVHGVIIIIIHQLLFHSIGDSRILMLEDAFASYSWLSIPDYVISLVYLPHIWQLVFLKMRYKNLAQSFAGCFSAHPSNLHSTQSPCLINSIHSVRCNISLQGSVLPSFHPNFTPKLTNRLKRATLLILMSVVCSLWPNYSIHLTKANICCAPNNT